ELNILGPPAGLADVHEADRPLGEPRRALGLLVQFEEETALLRAGDEQLVAALGRALESAGLATAQQGVDGFEPRAGGGPERLRQARAVQRTRLAGVAGR